MFHLRQQLLCIPLAVLLTAAPAYARGGHGGGGHHGGGHAGHHGGHAHHARHAAHHRAHHASHHARHVAHHAHHRAMARTANHNVNRNTNVNRDFNHGGFGRYGYGRGWGGWGWHGGPGLWNYGGGWAVNPGVTNTTAVVGVPAAAQTLSPQAAPAATAAETDVIAPAGARVTLDGVPADTTTGVRHFTSPPLQPGKVYTTTAQATWTRNGQPVTRVKTADVHAGEHVTLNMTAR